ncbi:hypothetical protein C4J81_05940 [Deltaproteobacteria bacterium Smac51]|nr:hypothetical protein C4J81_05940 [Deltaproteobacteria bacterium Smac51]
MPIFASKKKNPGYSYFASGVSLSGRLCFNGIIRLDGRVKGEIISSGTLVVEETAVISGNIMVENIILSGTVHGNIKAAKQIHLNATAKVYGDLHYGELSIEGAVHEGKSHKLTAEEIEQIQMDCTAALEEDIVKPPIDVVAEEQLPSVSPQYMMDNGQAEEEETPRQVEPSVSM